LRRYTVGGREEEEEEGSEAGWGYVCESTGREFAFVGECREHCVGGPDEGEGVAVGGHRGADCQ
jgi:hypothetical protein